MSTGPREGNIVVDSDDDSRIFPETAETVNLENDGIAREEEECLQFGPAEDASQILEECNDVELPPSVAKNATNTQSTKRPAALRANSMQVTHKKKRSNKDDLCDTLRQSIQQRNERARQRADDRKTLLQQNSNFDDPLYNFFISMYQLTKKMPPKYQHKVRGQVYNSVAEAEADIMYPPSDRPFCNLFSRFLFT
ncbi:uncharacterized protein LOC126734308 [Anthonomus grandis grandis]|uniref:uncharacterized protein LOC126734308 n=1 Tax=Anthonomus grandis grandis TaxID=2921223 RepID=UPI002164F411|nr:uncharacterized protein LOC126734308 [Anthonomus grandis grandis]